MKIEELCSGIRKLNVIRFFEEAAALIAACFAASAILIPAADYVLWDNLIGLCFVVLLLYGLIRSLVPQVKEFFRSWKRLIPVAVILLAAGCVFFGIRSPHFLMGETNLVTIYPGNFTIHSLSQNKEPSNRLPCTGYIVGECPTWKVKFQQTLTPLENAEPLTLKFSTRFIRKNKFCLDVSFSRPGILQYQINDDKMELSVPEARRYRIPLDSPSLHSLSKHRFSIERFIFFAGLTVLLLLGIVFVWEIGRKIVRCESVSWDLMLVICTIFLVYIAPMLLYGINCSDLAYHEPHLPIPRIYKHPPLIAVCWRTLHLLIPAKSVFVSFAVGSLLMYFAGLLMTERVLCKIKEKWPAWIAFLILLGGLRFYQNRVLVDVFLCITAFFTLGLLLLLLDQKRKWVLYAVLVPFVPLAVMIMGLRHEAAGISYVFCVALAGLLVRRLSSRRRFRKIAYSIAVGTVLFAVVFGIHWGLIKYVFPVEDKDISYELDNEFRRYQLKEILKICYFGKHYDWLPEDFSKCLPEGFDKGAAPFRLGNRELAQFKPLSSERISSVWKTMIWQHPFIYLRGKVEGYCKVCDRLDGFRANWPSSGFCFGFFSPHLPSWLCCGALLLTFLLSVILLMHRPIFRGILYLAAVTSAAGTAHMAALFFIPVSPQARYLYWVYASSGISLALLLYIVWLLVWARLGRASTRQLYIIGDRRGCK